MKKIFFGTVLVVLLGLAFAVLVRTLPYRAEIVVTDWQLHQNPKGSPFVTGTAVNKGAKDVGAARIDFEIYDKHGDMFGTLGGFALPLKSNEPVAFTVSLVPDVVKVKYKGYILVDPKTKKAIKGQV